MQEYINKFSEFWIEWGPWIGLALIPTVITGLSLSPRTEKAAGVVKKIWEYTKKLLDVLSVVTFKDKSGTFQLPLKVTKLAPKNKKSGDKSGPGCAAMILIIGLSATQPSCSWFKDAGSKAADVSFDCTIAAVQSNAAHLLPAVMAILTGKAPNWKQMLEAFTKELGADAVACALQEAAIELQGRVALTGSGEPTPESQAAMDGAVRARTFVDMKGWKYVEE